MRLIQLASVFALIAVGFVACGKRGNLPDPDLARFVASKRAQAKQLAAAQTNSVPATVWDFFDMVERNNWPAATNLFGNLRMHAAHLQTHSHEEPSRLKSAWQNMRQKAGFSDGMEPALDTELWLPLAETIGAYEQFHDWDLKWLRRFGRDIIDSIPSNSVYFGGTSAGQYVIAALSDSHHEGRPFFTLTQNQLRDQSYLNYLRMIYGPKLYVPTSVDVRNAFQEHSDFVIKRLKNEGPKLGELMPIEALLVKVIMERNPGREFYLQESHTMERTYPHLSPHGLIFKLHREPLEELSEAIVAADRDYWAHYVKELLGDWLTPETSVKEICDFSDRVFRRNDLSGLRGDREFTQNKAAQKEFSKLRAAIGKLYAWRAEHASSPKEKERMLIEADLAFRQALALCPYSPETVFPYAQLLVNQQRWTEVRLIAETWHQIDPGDQLAQGFLDNLDKNEKAR